MFERFTKAAREAVRSAVVLAQGEGSPVVRADHLFIAIARAEGPGAQLLRQAGWQGDVEALRRRFADADRRGGLSSADLEALSAIGVDAEGLLARLADGSGGVPAGRRPTVKRGHRPFAPEAKKALENSLRAAIARGDRSIGEEHLLLGLLASPGVVADELAAEGITRETLGSAWREAS
jgi:ATP-dependent Clp protease ATP-binding subunit ClpA